MTAPRLKDHERWGETPVEPWHSGWRWEIRALQQARTARFMSSLLSLWRTHRDHEPDRPRARPRPRNRVGQSRTSSRTRTKGRFMSTEPAFTALAHPGERVTLRRHVLE